jgi:hypothetical protein
MDTTNALDDSLEKLGDQTIDLVDFTNLKNFLQLSQKECFFDTISKWPEI